jgi:hypothetical protein
MAGPGQIQVTGDSADFEQKNGFAGFELTFAPDTGSWNWGRIYFPGWMSRTRNLQFRWWATICIKLRDLLIGS